MIGRITPFNPRSPVHQSREPFTFYWDDEGPGSHLLLSCASFRQEKTYEVELSVELVASCSPKAQVEAVVTASNLKGDARARLLVDVQAVTLAFDEVFDAAQVQSKIALPFQFTQSPDGDQSIFRNSGPFYEPD